MRRWGERKICIKLSDDEQKKGGEKRMACRWGWDGMHLIVSLTSIDLGMEWYALDITEMSSAATKCGELRIAKREQK